MAETAIIAAASVSVLLQVGILYLSYTAWRSFGESVYGRFFRIFTAGWVIIFLHGLIEFADEIGVQGLPAALDQVAVIVAAGSVVVAYAFWLLREQSG